MPPAFDLERAGHINAGTGPVFTASEVCQRGGQIDFRQPGRRLANLSGLVQDRAAQTFIEPFFNLLRVVASVEDFRLQL